MKGKSGRELFPEKLFSCSKAPAWEQVSQLVWTMNASFLTPAGKSAIVSPMKTHQTTINRKKYLPSHKVFRKIVWLAPPDGGSKE
jgi:hypothetical protein